MKCVDCKYFHEVEEWYFADECLQVPMPVESNDPACCMFERKEGEV